MSTFFRPGRDRVKRGRSYVARCGAKFRFRASGGCDIGSHNLRFCDDAGDTLHSPPPQRRRPLSLRVFFAAAYTGSMMHTGVLLRAGERGGLVGSWAGPDARLANSHPRGSSPHMFFLHLSFF